MSATLAKRTTPRQGRARIRVQAILEAATRLLVEAGYDALTTTRVAEEAGISVTSLYHYFANKRAIVAELTGHFVRHRKSDLDMLIERANRGEPWPGIVDTLIDDLTQAYRAAPVTAVILHALKADPELRKLDDRINAQVARQLTRLLEAMGIAKRRASTLARIATIMLDAYVIEVVRVPQSALGTLSREFKNVLTAYIALDMTAAPRR